METHIGRWGNSLAVRIPRAFARELQLAEGGTVELLLEDGSLLLRPPRQRYDLDQLLAAVTPENRHAETDWGEAAGAEVW